MSDSYLKVFRKKLMSNFTVPCNLSYAHLPILLSSGLAARISASKRAPLLPLDVLLLTGLCLFGLPYTSKWAHERGFGIGSNPEARIAELGNWRGKARLALSLNRMMG